MLVDISLGLLFCVILAFVCFVPTSFHLRHRALTIEGDQNQTSTLIAPKATKATFLYIVGVEGVGHHGVSPAIASIAQYCQQHVLYEHKVLRTHFSHMSTLKFKTTLAQLTTVLSPKSVLFIEGSSFPTDRVRRNSPDNNKRLFGLYNINWLYDQAKQANVAIKFLHLTRDFYRTVASHPEFDGTFEKHAEVLHDYLWYIDTEYRSIEAKESGLWRQIKYEWFTEMDNCTALAAAIVDFMGWSECNLSQACAILREDLRPPTPRAVNETEYAFTQTFNVSVSTPLLNISLSSNYSFLDNAHLLVPVQNISRIPGRPRWVPDTTPVSRYAFPKTVRPVIPRPYKPMNYTKTDVIHNRPTNITHAARRPFSRYHLYSANRSVDVTSVSAYSSSHVHHVRTSPVQTDTTNGSSILRSTKVYQNRMSQVQDKMQQSQESGASVEQQV